MLPLLPFLLLRPPPPLLLLLHLLVFSSFPPSTSYYYYHYSYYFYHSSYYYSDHQFYYYYFYDYYYDTKWINQLEPLETTHGVDKWGQMGAAQNTPLATLWWLMLMDRWKGRGIKGWKDCRLTGMWKECWQHAIMLEEGAKAGRRARWRRQWATVASARPLLSNLLCLHAAIALHWRLPANREVLAE